MKNNYHPFRKKWGQNFLTDKNLLDKIINLINLDKSDSIIEIGPGEGSLTKKIAPLVHEIVAVEIDPLLIEYLNKNLLTKNLKVIKGDILLQVIDDLNLKKNARIVGNIPYNITSSIIFWLIEQLDFWDDAYIMMQKEVADRLSANIGTKAYGRLTVVVGAYLNTEQCLQIPPEVFIPRPKVNSCIIRFTKKQKPAIPDDKYIKFSNIVRAAFSQRRKMLRNSLSGFDIDNEIVEKINFTRRPESLTIDEFATLV